MDKCSVCNQEFTHGQEFVGLVQYIAMDNIDTYTSQVVLGAEQTQGMMYFHKSCLAIE